MKLLAVFAAVLFTVSASTDQDQWVEFKQTHGKTYKSLLEERTRFGIFQNNLRKIEGHNAKYDSGEKTYYLGVTRFADMTQQEFLHMLGRQNKNRPNFNTTLHKFPKDIVIPEAMNWVQRGAVLPVKDQQSCGACWAFSVTGSLEGQNIILNNVRTPLSEQQLVDCSASYGNGDCDEGGLMGYGFQYITDFGIESESSYPYKSEVQECTYRESEVALRIQGYEEIEANEEQLKNAVGSIGPITAAINANYLGLYKGGIINEPDCNDTLNHEVLAVGYASDNGNKFWILKNSWGINWGETGYFRLAKDAGNMCGIATMTTFPRLK